MAGELAPMDRPGKPTLAGQIREALRKRILGGALEPGERLNLDALKQEYSISLSSLREAVTQLSSDGLIETQAQRGYRVAPISLANLDEVTCLRAELEPLALRLAMRNGGLDWETDVMGNLYRLNHTVRRPDDPGSVAAWEDAHNKFHVALIDRCDMPLLMKFHGILMNMNDRYRHLFLRIQADQSVLVAEHTAIAEAATQRRENEAVALLTEHITKTGAALKRHLNDELPQSAG